MNNVNFFSDLRSRWEQLDNVGRTSAKLVVSAVITAIVFSAIALTLHFVVQGSSFGKTIDALLMVTALPLGTISVVIQLFAAVLLPSLARCNRENSREEIARGIQELRSRQQQDVHNFVASSGNSELAKKIYGEVLKTNGQDLISLLKQLKEGTWKPNQVEQVVFLSCAVVVGPLNDEEKALCREYGIDPEKVTML